MSLAGPAFLATDLETGPILQRWEGEPKGVTAYFRESNGDFLAVDTATNRYYRDNFGQDRFEGRATAIAGLVGSVCTTGISREFLRRNCQRVAENTVPGEWLRAIGL
jgi:hypothetical protein